MPVVRSRALVLFFVLLCNNHSLPRFSLRHRLRSLAVVRLHLIRIAGWAEGVALLECRSRCHDISLAKFGYGRCRKMTRYNR